MCHIALLGEKASDGAMQLGRQMSCEDLAVLESNRCAMLTTDRHMRHLVLLDVDEGYDKARQVEVARQWRPTCQRIRDLQPRRGALCSRC